MFTDVSLLSIGPIINGEAAQITCIYNHVLSRASRPALGPTQLPIYSVPALSRGVKLTPHLAPRLKKE